MGEKEKLLYTIKETCSMLGIKKSKVYELVEEGQLQKVKKPRPSITGESIRRYYAAVISEGET